MAFDSTNGTKLANLVNPQVIADFIDSKLTDYIRLAPLATIDTTLQGRAGSVITVPTWNYIGDASTVSEGADIGIAKLTASTDTATIHKIGKGVEITDEAVLSGLGNPVDEASMQLLLSIASGVENEMLTTLNGIATGMTYDASGTGLTADAISDALIKFGEDIDGDKVLVTDPAGYGVLRKSDDWIPNTEIGAEMIIKGAVGMVHGCQVVVSNRLTGNKASFIVKPNALRLFIKRDSLVEMDRDIIGKFTVITADKHFVTYLYDASKAIKIKTAQ